LGNSLLYIAMLFAPVLLAGILLFYVKFSESSLKLLLAFSAAYLIGLCFLHLVPEIFSVPTSPRPGLWIIAGFFIQVLLEFLSSGIEHGHAHIHAHDKKFPLGLLIGLYLHSFIEGLPLAGIFSGSQSREELSFLTGVTLHNIPVSLALTGLLLHEHITKNKIVLYLLLFSLMAPLGALFGNFVIANYTGSLNLSVIFTGIVVGIFLHIGTTIIFEGNEKDHRYHINKLVSIIVGAALAYALT
jgi:zinc transporter ZupT